MSRYNEDIKWAYDYKHLLTVYNKGSDDLDINSIPLQNVGREAHTFLYHIINNYDSLAETTIFFQGMINDRNEQKIMPFDKYLFNSKNNITGKLSYCEEDYNWNYDYYNNKIGKSKYTLGDFCEKILKKKFIYPLKFVRGAYISVGKNLILQNPKNYYENILNNSFLSTYSDLEDAHFMERLWIQIFCGIPISQ